MTGSRQSFKPVRGPALAPVSTRLECTPASPSRILQRSTNEANEAAGTVLHRAHTVLTVLTVITMLDIRERLQSLPRHRSRPQPHRGDSVQNGRMERPAEIRFPALGVSLRCGEPEAAAESARSLGDRLLLTIRYGAAPGSDCAGPEPFLDVPNRVLGRTGPTLELWAADMPVARGAHGSFRLAETPRALFGAARYPFRANSEAAAFTAYRELLELLDRRGRAEIVRIWNYLPGIHESVRGLERYRAFNVGRAAAFADRFGAGAPASYPASSAVGTLGDDLLIAFAAAREPVRQVENPRQVSAWRYPPRYGSVGPTFARAAIAPASWGSPLFLSGTASIVGHETRHPDQLAPQIGETLENIDHALEAARSAGWPAAGAWGPIKVYLRHATDWPAARGALAAAFPAGTAVVALEAEICRDDLRIEIEGVFPGAETLEPH